MIRTKFVLCIKNNGYRASLEPRKLYVRIPDKSAESHDLVRVTDESGEDYLYPASLFVPVSLSSRVMKAMTASA